MVLSVAGGLLLAVLALWLGHRSLASGGASGGVGNALSAGFEAFDPGRARAQEDLDSKDHEGEALPTPNPEDVPVRVDLKTGKAHIRKVPPPV